MEIHTRTIGDVHVLDISGKITLGEATGPFDTPSATFRVMGETDRPQLDRRELYRQPRGR
jgi:hypothetical protein